MPGAYTATEIGPSHLSLGDADEEEEEEQKRKQTIMLVVIIAKESF